MLVLTRKPNAGNQSIVTIGPNVEVTVIEIKGDQVKIGITAPEAVPVHRKEIYLQAQQQNEEAGQTSANGPASTAGKTLEQVRRMQK